MSRIISIECRVNKISSVVLVSGELFDYKTLKCKSNTINNLSVLLEKIIKGYNTSKEDIIVMDTSGVGIALFDVLKEKGLNVTPVKYITVKRNLPYYWTELNELIKNNEELQEIKDRYQLVETTRKGELALDLKARGDLYGLEHSSVISALVNAVYGIEATR